MNIHIVTDSTCDLPEEIISRHSITVIPLVINVGAKTFLDGVDLTRREFYTQLPNFNPHPKTAAPGSMDKSTSSNAASFTDGQRAR